MINDFILIDYYDFISPFLDCVQKAYPTKKNIGMVQLRKRQLTKYSLHSFSSGGMPG